MATQIVQASANATRPTFPLTPAAAEALARLERAFAPGPSMSEADRRAHELASYVRRPASTLGNLAVERRSILGTGETTLDRVPVGVPVTVTATIAGLRTFSGRVRMVLDDGQGGSANVVVDSSKVVAAFRGTGTPPRVGARVELHGVVTPPVGSMPKGIEAHAVRVAL